METQSNKYMGCESETAVAQWEVERDNKMIGCTFNPKSDVWDVDVS